MDFDRIAPKPRGITAFLTFSCYFRYFPLSKFLISWADPSNKLCEKRALRSRGKTFSTLRAKSLTAPPGRARERRSRQASSHFPNSPPAATHSQHYFVSGLEVHARYHCRTGTSVRGSPQLTCSSPASVQLGSFSETRGALRLTGNARFGRLSLPLASPSPVSFCCCWCCCSSLVKFRTFIHPMRARMSARAGEREGERERKERLT